MQSSPLSVSSRVSVLQRERLLCLTRWVLELLEFGGFSFLFCEAMSYIPISPLCYFLQFWVDKASIIEKTIGNNTVPLTKKKKK